MKSFILVIALIATSFSASGKRYCARPHHEIIEITTALRKYKSLPASVIRDLRRVINHLDKTGNLPKKYISKAQACRLNWSHKICNSPQGPCNLQTIARGKKIGGDEHHNTYGWPADRYLEADLGEILSNQCRNSFRLVYSEGLDKIYFSPDHYRSFTRLR